MQIGPQVVASLRTHLRRRIERIAHAARPHLGGEVLEEPIRHALDHDEALRRDAALAAVLEPRLGGRRRGAGQVGVFEHDERIAAAELKHGLLQVAAGLGADRAASAVRAREGHGAHAGVGDHPRHGGVLEERGPKQPFREPRLA